MGEPRPHPDRPTRIKPMTLALTAAGVLAGWTALLPESVRPWNFAAVGAVGLFAAARLRFGTAVAVVVLALAVKDAGYYLIRDWSPEPLSWVAFLAYLLVGRGFLRNTEAPLRIGTGAVLASLLFFAVSNFGSWLGQALPYGYSFAGLMDCYRAAIPFYRGTFAGDLAFTGLLFGLHAALSRAYFPAERVALQPERSPVRPM
jgi:hypothetical protein